MSPIHISNPRSASVWYRTAPYRRGITAGQYLALAVLIVVVSGLRSSLADTSTPTGGASLHSDDAR
jgi:hypothetical protein